ncbi:MAG: integrase, partial [Syntrophobacteraceae bacterium]
MDSETGRVIRFPGTQEKVSPKAPRQVQNVDGIKYYTDQQIKLLRRTVRDQAALDIERGQVTAIREWMAIDLVTSSGLRVSEAANVRCGDI